jgi:hypothetical protein
MVLPLHCWTLAAAADIRARTRAMLLAIGLLPPLAIAATYMHELAVGPLDALWGLFLLVTGGQVVLPAALAGCVVLGVLGSAAAIVLAHARLDEAEAEGASRRVSHTAARAGARSFAQHPRAD